MTNCLLRPKGSFFCPDFALCGPLGKPGGNTPLTALLGAEVRRRPTGSLRPSASLVLPHSGSVKMELCGHPSFLGCLLGMGAHMSGGNTMSFELLPYFPPPPPGSVFYWKAHSSSHLLPDPYVGEGGDNSRCVWGLGAGAGRRRKPFFKILSASNSATASLILMLFFLPVT